MHKLILLSQLCLIPLFVFSQNTPPYADAGGPYYGTTNEGTGVSVTLDGSGSYDIDSPGDEIVKYLWDTDGDGLYGSDDTDGSFMFSAGSDAEGATVDIVSDFWMIGNTYPIALVVEDSYGSRSNPATTTLAIRPNDTDFPVYIHDLIIDDIVSGDALLKINISHPYTEAQTFNISFEMSGFPPPLVCFDDENNPVTQLYYEGNNIISEYNVYFDSEAFQIEAGGADGGGYQIITYITNAAETYEVNKATKSFTIDNTAPEISCPGNQTRAADQSNLYTAVGDEFDPFLASDNISNPVSLSNDINSLESLDGYDFGLGNTVITWTAEDEAGNTSTCNFNLEISAYTDLEDPEINHAAVYPNPAGDLLRVDIYDANEATDFVIRNFNGMLIQKINITEKSMYIDLSDFSNGVYTISINYLNKPSLVKKIIVAR